MKLMDKNIYDCK